MSELSEKHSIMRRYDLTSHIYDMRYAEEQTAKIDAAMESIDVKKRSIVLDVGCGTGLLFDHVAEKAETVVGLDISRKSLLHAKNRSQRFTNVSLIWADADNLPFNNDVFSHAFAITLLQNMPNPTETLKEVKRVTKNDAVIVVTGLKRKFPLERFVRLLRKIGLNIVEVKDENLKCYVAICSKIH